MLPTHALNICSARSFLANCDCNAHLKNICYRYSLYPAESTITTAGAVTAEGDQQQEYEVPEGEVDAYAVPKRMGILRVLPCIENEQGGGKCAVATDVCIWDCICVCESECVYC